MQRSDTITNLLGDSQIMMRGANSTPLNTNVVYVAAQGHVWGSNAERGIFRSRDGGKTWDKVLFVSDKTGASDLCMDPSNPRILYAGTSPVGVYRSDAPGK